MLRKYSLLWGAILATWATTEISPAQDFRIESDVFLNDQDAPVAQNVTLFASGLIYDFPLVGTEEITVFDPVRGRFVLLDVTRKIKTTVTKNELIQFTAAIKVRAKELKGAFGFAANPEFQVRFDEDSHWLTLDSKLLSYRAKGLKPKRPEAAREFRVFADWYARLNSTQAGNLPPFARMELNRQLAEKGLMPEEVELTVSPSNRLLSRPVTIRSRHLIDWSLSQTDRKRVARAGKFMAEFKAVPFQDYRKATQVAAADQ